MPQQGGHFGVALTHPRSFHCEALNSYFLFVIFISVHTSHEIHPFPVTTFWLELECSCPVHTVNLQIYIQILLNFN